MTLPSVPQTQKEMAERRMWGLCSKLGDSRRQSSHLWLRLSRVRSDPKDILQAVCPLDFLWIVCGGSANYLTVWSSLGVQSAPWFLTLLSWMVPFRTQGSLSNRTLLRSGFASQLQAGPYQKQVPIAKPRSPYPLKVSLHVTKPRSCVMLSAASRIPPLLLLWLPC